MFFDEDDEDAWNVGIDEACQCIIRSYINDQCRIVLAAPLVLGLLLKSKYL